MYKNIKLIVSGVVAFLIAQWLYHVLSQDPNINIWIARLLPIPLIFIVFFSLQWLIKNLESNLINFLY